MPKSTALNASSTFSDDAVEVLDRRSFAAGRYRVDRYRLRHKMFGGGWSDPLERDVLERGHAAALLPYDPVADAIVLVEQFRIGALAAGQAPWMLEVVAGMIEADDADPEAVARRESMEECGCRVGSVEPIAVYQPSPGGAAGARHLFCGRLDRREAPAQAGLVEEGEDLRVHVWPWSKARRALDQGVFTNAATLIALHWLARRRPALRRRWNGAAK
ncbi:MAG: NUDIX domain-containing protein [Elsteraceae bacterium]